MLGEADFKHNNYNNIELINTLRLCLQNITHTNIIICTPTYVQGALMYNYKVEMFNNMLYVELQNNKYTYFCDTNEKLTPQMFSEFSGRINKYGLRYTLQNIMERFKIDFIDFPYIITEDEQLKNSKNTVPFQNNNCLFRV